MLRQYKQSDELGKIREERKVICALNTLIEEFSTQFDPYMENLSKDAKRDCNLLVDRYQRLLRIKPDLDRNIQRMRALVSQVMPSADEFELLNGGAEEAAESYNATLNFLADFAAEQYRINEQIADRTRVSPPSSSSSSSTISSSPHSLLSQTSRSRTTNITSNTDHFEALEEKRSGCCVLL